MATISNIVVTKFTQQGGQEVGKTVTNLGNGVRQLGDNSANAARGFGSMQKGLGGFVGAYAGAAATFFALQQAYSALKDAAKVEQSIAGTRLLAAEIGESGDKILESIKNITKGQLTLKDATEATNLALTSGFSGEQIEKLTLVATKASRALGRDLGDSYIRLIRGAAKLEPELLDELGIFTRIEPAIQSYAAQMGTAEKFLTNFERRQAFVNAVTEEGTRKYANIGTAGNTSAASIERLATSLFDLGQKITGVLATTFAPFADFLSGSLANSFSAIGILGALAFSKLFQVITSGLHNVNTRFSTFNDNIQTMFKSAKSPEVLANLQAVAKTYSDKTAITDNPDRNAIIKAVTAKDVKTSDINKFRNDVMREAAAARSQFDAANTSKKPLNIDYKALAPLIDTRGKKELTEAIQKQIVAAGITTASRGSGVGLINKGQEKDIIESVKAEQAIRKQIAALQEYDAMQTKTSKNINSILVGTQKVGAAVINGLDKMASGFSKVLFWLSLIEIGGSLLLKIFGAENAFDIFLKNILDVGAEIFGLTKRANEFKAVIASIADISLNKEFKNAGLGETTKFDFKESFLGYGYNSSKDQSELSKMLNEDLSKATAAANKRTINRDAKTGAVDVAMPYTDTLSVDAFNKSLDETIKKYEAMPALTYEAVRAQQALIKAVNDTRKAYDSMDVMQQLTGKGITPQQFQGVADMSSYKTDYYKTDIAFKDTQGNDQSYSIDKLAELKRKEKELEKLYTYSPQIGTTEVPVYAGSRQADTFRNSDSFGAPTLDVQAFNEAKKQLMVFNDMKLVTEALNINLRSTDNYLKNGTLNAEGMAKQFSGLQGNLREIAKLEAYITDVQTGAALVNQQEYDVVQKRLETLKKIYNLKEGEIKQAQGLLTLETQLAKSFASEISAAQEFQGMINAEGKLVNQPHEVRANLMTNLDKYVDTSKLKDPTKGLDQVLSRLGHTSALVLKGMVPAIGNQIKKERDDMDKAMISNYLEVMNSYSAVFKEQIQARIQEGEIEIKQIQTKLEYDKQILDIDSQRVDLMAKLASLAIEQQINSLNSAKELLDINHQIYESEVKRQILAKEKADIDKNAKLQFTSDLSGDLGSNLYSDESKRQIKISIDESALETLRHTTALQIEAADKASQVKKEQLEIERGIAQKQYELVAIQSAAEIDKLANEKGKIAADNAARTAESGVRNKQFEDQKLLLQQQSSDTQNKIQADRDLKALEFKIIQQRIDILVQESNMLSKHADVIAKLITMDIAVKELTGPEEFHTPAAQAAKASSINFGDQLKFLHEAYFSMVKPQIIDLPIKSDALKADVAQLAGNNETIFKNSQKAEELGLASRLKGITAEQEAYNLEKSRKDTINNSLLKNIQLQEQAARATAANAMKTYELTIKKIGAQEKLDEKETANAKTQLENAQKTAEAALANQKRLAELANSPFFLFANDFVGIVKNDMTKGLLELNQAFIDGTLSMASFTEGLKDWSYSLLKDIQKSFVTRTIVEPITNFATDFLGSAVGDAFGVPKIEGALVQTGSGLAMRVIDSKSPDAKSTTKTAGQAAWAGLKGLFGFGGAAAVGAEESAVNKTLEGATPTTQGIDANGQPYTISGNSDPMAQGAAQASETQTQALQEQATAAGAASSSLGDYASSFGKFGVAIGGSLAAVIASGGDFKTSLLGIFASLFAQILLNALTSSQATAAAGSAGSAGGAAGGAGGILGGLGSLFGSIFGGSTSATAGSSAGSWFSSPTGVMSDGFASSLVLASSGGSIQALNSGGQVQNHSPIASVFALASGGKSGRDTVPTMLEPGEFVMRKSAAKSLGMSKLTDLNNHGDNASWLDTTRPTTMSAPVAPMIMPMPVAAPSTPTAPTNVSVNVNNTGTQQEVQGKPSVRMNGQQMVIDIVTRDFANNGPIRQSMRGNSF